MHYSKFPLQSEVLVATRLNIKERINIKVIYSNYENYVCNDTVYKDDCMFRI